MRVPVEQVRAVAVRGGVHASVPFDAAPVIGRTGEGRFLELARFGGGDVEGTELTEPELQACVEGGDVTFLPSDLPVQAGLIAWIFASAESAREVHEELARVGAWRHLCAVGHGEILLVRRPECEQVRASLHQRHLDDAKAAIVRCDATRAMKHATWAWLLARPVVALDVAVLVRAHELAGQAERGQALRAMERNSHGASFDASVAIELERMPLNRLRLVQLASLRRQEDAYRAEMAA